LSPGSSGPETTKKREILIVSDERNQSLFIIVYPGKETAEDVYHTLRAFEKQDQIDIKTAATGQTAAEASSTVNLMERRI
jgi:hypothetical protein